MDYNNQLSKISHLQKLQLDQTNSWFKYWNQYSDYHNWQFWFILALLLIPLIVLFMYMDRKKVLLLGFFGYNVHVFFTYIDVFGANHVYWFYPYQIFPLLSSSFPLDVSFIPVSFILVYQWTLNRNKNYYLYTFILSAVLSLIFKPILSTLGLFQLQRGAQYWHLMILYFVIAIISKLITNLFLYLQHKSEKA
jgi:hypothetical protein